MVADAAQERFGELPGVAEFDGYPGLGMRGIVSELRAEPDDEPRVIAHAALVGRVSLLTGHGIDLPAELADAVTTVQAAGATAVAVSWDGVARAVLEVVDPVRPGAAEAVRGLRRLGLLPVLLTGDDAGAARGLAATLGVEEVVAEVAAADRGSAVARLRAAGCTVAVVGGPADEAALSEADVALAHRGAAEIDGGARETRVVPGRLRSECGGRAVVRGHPPRRRPAHGGRRTPDGPPDRADRGAHDLGCHRLPPRRATGRGRRPAAPARRGGRGGRLSRGRPAARRRTPPNSSPTRRDLIAAGHGVTCR